MRTYEIVRGALDRDALSVLGAQMLAEHLSRDTSPQSGFALSDVPGVLSQLAPLLYYGKLWLGKPVTLVASKSSCRLQPPTKERALTAHQDTAAIGYHEGVVAWVPLTHIDEFTPTLAVCPTPTAELPHGTDKAGYSVLRDNILSDLIPLTSLAIGDIVMLGRTTVHATYIPPGANKSRISLDVRMLPE